MAVRTITTRIALDGETQFKQAMTSINGAMRNLKSEIALSEAQFKGQANTVAALTAKNKLLLDSIDQQKEKIKTLNDILKRSTDIYGEESSITDKYRQQLNRAQAELIGLDRELVNNSKYLKEARNSADGTAKSIDGFGKSVKGAGDSVNQLAGVLQAAGVAYALNEIAGAIRAGVDASMEFETAMANVNKVAKLSDAELREMGDAIKQLSTEMPATTGEIAQVVEASARLGVAKEDLIDFSKVMLDLGNVSDLSSDQAATALARFANITGTASEDYSRLGSVVVALGNNFATSESEIVAMSSRLAAAGELAGLSEAQIMGLAAAMTSVGIEAEAGGTAMTQTLTAMEKAVTSGGARLEAFAQVAGVSSQEFSDAWENDPILAVQAFIDGLAGLDERGESATQVLEELGLSGIRQANMLKSLSLANETLNDTLTTANQAWIENTELAETAAAKYDTTQVKLDMASNAANNLAIAFGDALAPALGVIAELRTAAFTWLSEVIEKHPAVVAGITAVVGVLAVGTAGVMAYKTAAGLAAEAQAAFNVVLSANPIGAVVALVAGLAAALTVLISKIRGAKDETDDLNQSQEEQSEAADQAAQIEAQVAQAMEEAAAATRDATAALESGTAAAQDQAAAAQDQAAALGELENASLYLAGAQDTLAKALKEQEAEGSLSLKTTLDLIEAGYDAALAVDEETGAVTLNRSSYVNLTQAKINDQIAALETQKQALITAARVEAEALAAQHAGSAYWEMAAAKLYAEKADTASIDAQIAAMNRLKDSLAQNPVDVPSYAPRQPKDQKPKDDRKVKTQAEKDLDAYKAAKAELDHQKAMDLVNEEEYYRKLASYRDQYLTDDANVSEYRKVTEQIYKYDKSLAGQAEKDLEAYKTARAELDHQKAMDLVSEEEYYQKLAGYRDQYLTDDENVSEYRKVNEEIYKYNKSLASQAEKDLEAYKSAREELDHQKAMDLVSEEEYYQKLASYRDQYLTDDENVSEYRKVSEEIYKYNKSLASQAEKDLEAYKSAREELDHQKALDLVSEEEYYRKLAAYRDQYLTDDENVSEYRKITEEIYKYDKALADQQAQLWADQTNQLVSELESRVKSVTDQQNRMEGQLGGYGDLFQIKDNRLSLNSLQSQINAIDKYEDVLSGLKERGISGGLMDEILGMDVDSATRYGQKLLGMGEKQWEEYNALWEKKQERATEVAEQFFKDQIDALETEYNNKLDSAFDSLTDTSFGAGKDTGQGLIDGLASKEDALYEQAQKMAGQVSEILAGAGRVPSNSELASSFSTQRIVERFQGVTGEQLQNATVGAVNALSTAQAGAVYPPVDVTLTIDGQTLARQQVDPMRQANRERPEALDDK